ncbi:MAG: SRPBCC family protein [Acidimicrobiales bacterium]
MATERVVAVEREIAAPPAPIFDLLADPAQHHRFDGSDTVVSAASSNPDRLSMGARFGMSMRLGVPYRMTNEVVEFESDRVIAWRHFGHHIWRYQLEPIESDRTLVTESFNWGTSRFPPVFYEWVGYPARHEINMATTLERLASLVEGASA